jgi:hypothetical protein
MAKRTTTSNRTVPTAASTRRTAAASSEAPGVPARMFEPDDDVELPRYPAPLPWPLGSVDEDEEEE